MTVEWTNVDNSNVRAFLDNATGRKLRELCMNLMPKKAGVTVEQSALAAERFFGFIGWFDFAERLTATKPEQAAMVSAMPWYQETVEAPGKSRNPS